MTLQEHRPAIPPVLAKHAVEECSLFEWTAAIPSDEKLRQVGIADDQGCRQHQFCKIFEVVHGDVVFELEDTTHRNEQCDYHRQSREDGARDEIRREDCAVPTGQDRHCEVPGHNAVY